MAARVLVIGLDAFEKDLLLTWAADGSLPTLAELLRRGTSGVVEGPAGIYGGTVWPSFNTGVSPARHRRFFRRQAPRGEYIDIEFKPDQMAVRSFWEVLSAAGRSVAIIDAPHATLSTSLNGVQLVDYASHEPDFEQALSYPPEFGRNVCSQFGHEPPDLCEETVHTAQGYRDLQAHLETRIRNTAAVTRYLLQSRDWDFLFTTLSEAHCAGHQWWHLHDPSHPRHDTKMAAEVGDLLKNLYITIDKAVGEILADVDSATQVIVVSGHGMGQLQAESLVLDEVLRRIEAPTGSGTNTLFSRLKQLWYRLPVSVRNSPVLDHIKSRLLPSLHQSLLIPERRARRFFAIPHNPHAGAIRINLAGRERHGIVQPGREYRELCDELRREMLALRCGVIGPPAVAEVIFSADEHPGPYSDELPDVLVQWNRNGPVATLTSERIGTVVIPAIGGRTGDHTREGLFIATGPGLAAQRLERTTAIVDFAPTIARHLDVESDEFDGVPIAELVVTPTR